MSKLSNYLKTNLARSVGALHPLIHQAPNYTALDRYPSIFSRAAAEMPDAKRILSFGCSTGEECKTLERYFTDAEIVGTDINPMNLMLAYWKAGTVRSKFVYADDNRLERLAPFDAIFCMNVLRVPRAIQLGGKLVQDYPFARFEERVSFLNSILRTGGILVIHKAIYRFCETAVFPQYRVLDADFPDEIGNRHFDMEGNRLETSYRDVLFRKLPPPIASAQRPQMETKA